MSDKKYVDHLYFFKMTACCITMGNSTLYDLIMSGTIICDTTMYDLIICGTIMCDTTMYDLMMCNPNWVMCNIMICNTIKCDTI